MNSPLADCVQIQSTEIGKTLMNPKFENSVIKVFEKLCKFEKVLKQKSTNE